MPSPRLAARYAKSLVDIAVEKNELENVNKDVRLLQSICTSSRDFVNVLRSPIIKPGVKSNIINAVTEGKVGAITKAFNQLLITKGREANLPEILTAFVAQYNNIKHIHRVKLTTAVAATEDMKSAILAKMKADTNMQNIELETKVDESLIGGFVLEMEGKMVDASVLRDLNDVKKQFMNNDYIYKVR
jgi:F-type H+-transporting ATPase subunit delta